MAHRGQWSEHEARGVLSAWRIDNARVPLDNNASERSLRRVALGRKNYLFVGDVEAGASIAGLYTCGIQSIGITETAAS